MRPFLATLLANLQERVGDGWSIVVRVFRPGQDAVNLNGINKHTILILWGDERSRVFPEEYFRAAGITIKCYCPESWEARGIIPVTDIAMSWDGDGESANLSPCSKRPHAVFFSGNFNYRRTDLFRACCARSFCWPFPVSACSPVTGYYPLFHKIEAAIIYRAILCLERRRDFSDLYPGSIIRFNDGYRRGIPSSEYLNYIRTTKIVWSAPGFMTNETSRLIEASCAGCVVMVGRLPENEIYSGNPFVHIRDWRKVREMTDELLNDESRLDELGANARKWYETHFSPSAQAVRIADSIKRRIV